MSNRKSKEQVPTDLPHRGIYHIHILFWIFIFFANLQIPGTPQFNTGDTADAADAMDDFVLLIEDDDLTNAD